MKTMLCFFIIFLTSLVPVAGFCAEELFTEPTYPMSLGGILRGDIRIYACTASEDCTKDGQLIIADAFCQNKGYDEADFYDTSDKELPFIYRRRDGGEDVHDIFLAACDAREVNGRSGRRVICNWNLKQFTGQRDGVDIFSQILCRNKP